MRTHIEEEVGLQRNFEEPADIPGTGDRVTTPGAPLSQQISEFSKWATDDPDAMQEWAQAELTEWILELRNRWAHELMALPAIEENGLHRLVNQGEIRATIVTSASAGGPSWAEVRARFLEHSLARLDRGKIAWNITCECGKEFPSDLGGWEKHQRARVKELFNG